MLANVLFRDIFATLNGGLVGAVTAGSHSGNAIQLGGSGPLGKLAFRFLFSMTASSASGTATLYLCTATASNGTFTSISQTVASMAFTTASYTSLLQLMVDTRNEAFCNLGTGTAAPTWVQPVLVTATSTVNGFLDVLGWEAGSDPANKFDVSTSTTETDFY